MISAQTDIHRDLIEQCKLGNRRYFHEIYRLYSGAMFNVCMRMLGKRHEAEDVLQEAFTDAFARIKDFRYESSFGYWLKQIVVNKCISFLRKRKLDLEYMEDIEQLDREEEVDSRSEYEAALQIEEVKKAMQELPAGSRSIFSLYLFEGYDHLEIAEILHITESTSKSQYMRARLKVKELLTRYAHEKG